MFSRAFCWQLQLFGQDNLRRNSFFLFSLCLFPSSGVFSALQDCEIEGMGPGFLFYHSSDQAGLPTYLTVPINRLHTDRREADGIHLPTIPVPYLYMR